MPTCSLWSNNISFWAFFIYQENFSCCRYANSANTVEVVTNVWMDLITIVGYFFALKCSLQTPLEYLSICFVTIIIIVVVIIITSTT